MNAKAQKTREMVGFTFSNVESAPGNWIGRAREFKEAAVLINEMKSDSLSFPYYYNAALSLELALKAMLVAQGKEINATHRLKDLSDEVGIKVGKDQESTLELLSEILIWLGRYPIPRNEGQWNNFHDALLPKHKVVVREGSVGRVMKNEKTFPTLKNYLSIWERFENEYFKLVPSKA